MSAAPSTSSEPVQLVVFSDLDGTLLDRHSYALGPAGPWVRRLATLGIPLVLCSSKTSAEIAHLRAEIGNGDPYVAENGAIVNLPEERIQVGRGRGLVLEVLARLRDREGFRFEGFHDWGADEIAERTGLDRASAERAADRQGTEPILWLDAAERFEAFERMLAAEGWRLVVGGRFVHVMDRFDKADGVRRVLDFLGDRFDGRSLRSVGLGDAPNDAAMLEAVDVPVLIRGPHSGEIRLHGRADAMRTRGVGPEGWAEAMEVILEGWRSEEAQIRKRGTEDG